MLRRPRRRLSPILRRRRLAALAACAGLALAAGLATGAAEGPAVPVGEFAWEGGWDGFGGFSAIEVGADGAAFTALSDRTSIVSGRLLRDAAGVVTGVEVTDGPRPLLDVDGVPLRGPRADSEGLAVGADGTAWIAFEGLARVRREGAEGPVLLPSHPDFAGMQDNASLEALAVDAGGGLYAIPERSGDADRPFPVYRFADGAWTVPFAVPRDGPFLVSGADVGPDGRLYVLERAFGGFGFRTRVRRYALDGTGGETVLETPTGTHDNLEGISVWDDGTSLRLTMIADDNFRFLQRTEIVEYRVPR